MPTCTFAVRVACASALKRTLRRLGRAEIFHPHRRIQLLGVKETFMRRSFLGRTVPALLTAVSVGIPSRRRP